MRVTLAAWAIGCGGGPEVVAIPPGYFTLTPSAEGWNLQADTHVIVPGVQALLWEEGTIIAQNVEGRFVIEGRPEVRRALTPAQNAERFWHGPLSDTGYFALLGSLEVPPRPVLVPVADAARCLAANTAASACTGG